jgi:hypothetical protein
MTLMAMWLGFDQNLEVFTSLCNSMNQHIISLWPLISFRVLLVVLSEPLLCDFLAEQSILCGFSRGLAGGIYAFNFGCLDAAGAIIVVVDCGLKDCKSISSCYRVARKSSAYHSGDGLQLHRRHYP